MLRKLKDSIWYGRFFYAVLALNFISLFFEVHTANLLGFICALLIVAEWEVRQDLKKNARKITYSVTLQDGTVVKGHAFYSGEDETC